MRQSLGDLFAELGAKLLPTPGAKLLPTPEDEARFLEAARDILATDPELKRQLKSRMRAKVFKGPIDTPARQAAVRAEIRRLLPYVTKDGAATVAVLRILTACLIIRGLNGADHRSTLLNAALFLREKRREIETLQRQAWDATRPKRRAGSDSATVKWARDMAAEWRANNPRKPKTEGASWLFKRALKQDRTCCRTVESFRVWTYRNRVVI